MSKIVDLRRPTSQPTDIPNLPSCNVRSHKPLNPQDKTITSMATSMCKKLIILLKGQPRKIKAIEVEVPPNRLTTLQTVAVSHPIVSTKRGSKYPSLRIHLNRRSGA